MQNQHGTAVMCNECGCFMPVALCTRLLTFYVLVGVNADTTTDDL